MENHPTNLGLIIIIMIACEPVYLGVYRDPFQLISQAKVDTKKTSQKLWNVLVIIW